MSKLMKKLDRWVLPELALCCFAFSFVIASIGLVVGGLYSIFVEGLWGFWFAIPFMLSFAVVSFVIMVRSFIAARPEPVDFDIDPEYDSYNTTEKRRDTSWQRTQRHL